MRRNLRFPGTATLDKPILVDMNNEITIIPNSPSASIVFLGGPTDHKPSYLNGPNDRLVSYNDDLVLATPARMGQQNAVYNILINILTEIVESGYSKESVRKQLVQGLVLETGYAPPALDDITGPGMKLPDNALYPQQ